MPQAQVGRNLKSMPKVTRVNADDDKAMVYKNLGNGRRVPFMWGVSNVEVASGATVVVASGVEFSDHRACDAAVQMTPVTSGTYASAPGGYVIKDTVNNIVSVRSTASVDAVYDIAFFMGASVEDIEQMSNMLWKRSSSARMG